MIKGDGVLRGGAFQKIEIIHMSANMALQEAHLICNQPAAGSNPAIGFLPNAMFHRKKTWKKLTVKMILDKATVLVRQICRR